MYFVEQVCEILGCKNGIITWVKKWPRLDLKLSHRVFMKAKYQCDKQVIAPELNVLMFICLFMFYYSHFDLAYRCFLPICWYCCSYCCVCIVYKVSCYTVNSVLERLFSGQFSLNVRTATIGQLQGHTSVEHGVWSQPQPQPVLPYHGGTYTCIYVCQHFTSWLQGRSMPTASEPAIDIFYNG